MALGGARALRHAALPLDRHACFAPFLAPSRPSFPFASACLALHCGPSVLTLSAACPLCTGWRLAGWQAGCTGLSALATASEEAVTVWLGAAGVKKMKTKIFLRSWRKLAAEWEERGVQPETATAGAAARQGGGKGGGGQGRGQGAGAGAGGVSSARRAVAAEAKVEAKTEAEVAAEAMRTAMGKTFEVDDEPCTPTAAFLLPPERAAIYEAAGHALGAAPIAVTCDCEELGTVELVLRSGSLEPVVFEDAITMCEVSVARPRAQGSERGERGRCGMVGRSRWLPAHGALTPPPSRASCCRLQRVCPPLSVCVSAACSVSCVLLSRHSAPFPDAPIPWRRPRWWRHSSSPAALGRWRHATALGSRWNCRWPEAAAGRAREKGGGEGRSEV